MKVLIVTYYWPPSGGSGVQRWLQFVKYLRDFGVEPIVYTVANPDYLIQDDSLAKHIPEGVQVLKQPIKEPVRFFKKFTKKKVKQSSGFIHQQPTFFQRCLQYIRANYFIPDARMFWIQPSVAYLSKYLKEHPVDAIITTGPPHSLHLIGLGVQEATRLKWIADFRDPWIDIDYFHQLPHTQKTIKKHRALEKQVATSADALIVVGNTMHTYFSQFSKNTYTITNGYDTELTASKQEVDSRFTLTHIGLMNADRNPKHFWNVLAELCNEHPNFKRDLKVQLIGAFADEVYTSAAQLASENVEFVGYLSHDEVAVYQQQSQVLLLFINQVPSAKGILTGKLFEYIQAKRPILAIGPKDGDAAILLEDTQTGVLVDYEDAEGLKTTLLDMYKLYTEHKLQVQSRNVAQYHRKALTKVLSEVLQKVVQTA